jgi:signal transduction histidine kinase
LIAHNHKQNDIWLHEEFLVKVRHLGIARGKSGKQTQLSKPTEYHQSLSEEINEDLLIALRSVSESEHFEDAARDIFTLCRQAIGVEAGLIATWKTGIRERGALLFDGRGAPEVIELSFAAFARYIDTEEWPDTFYENELEIELVEAELRYPDALRYRNIIVTPIRFMNEQLGVLLFANKPEGFATSDVHCVELAAELFSMALRTERDRNALRQSQTLIQDSSLLLQLVFNNIYSAVILTDAEGSIVLANPPALALLGLTEANIGESLVELLPDAAFMLVATKPGIRPQIRISSADGVLRHLGFTTAKVSLPRSEGYLTVFQDIGTIKRAETRRRRAEQLALVGEMAAKLSHEIKNPLSSLFAGLGLLELLNSNRSEELEIVNSLKGEVNRLALVTRELLDGAKPSKFTPIRIDLGGFIQDTVRSYETFCRSRGVELSMVGVDETISAHVDPNWFRRVLANLIINAAEAIDRQGNIEVSWRPISDEERSRWFPTYEMGVIAICVHDNGPGMPPSTLEKIFEPFYTTKSSGNGLGLSLAMEVVEAHGGLLTVRSVIGEGSCFIIFLPQCIRRPCWEIHAHANITSCETCSERSNGNGVLCWTSVERSSDRGPHPCQRCEVFNSYHLSLQSERIGSVLMNTESLHLVCKGMSRQAE